MELRKLALKVYAISHGLDAEKTNEAELSTLDKLRVTAIELRLNSTFSDMIRRTESNE